MSYNIIDQVIQKWAEKHALKIYVWSQDYEVRSTDIVDKDGAKYQLWIEPPMQDGEINIHIWDYKTRRNDYVANLSSFELYLEKAYVDVCNWIKAKID